MIKVSFHFFHFSAKQILSSFADNVRITIILNVGGETGLSSLCVKLGILVVYGSPTLKKKEKKIQHQYHCSMFSLIFKYIV